MGVFSISDLRNLSVSNQSYFLEIAFEDGIRYASAEKAFVDTLYFYQKGEQFPFDPFSDINMSLLNITVIRNSNLLSKE
jgi:hypothetical protein